MRYKKQSIKKDFLKNPKKKNSKNETKKIKVSDYATSMLFNNPFLSETHRVGGVF
jgi:hypothetical protein